MGKVYRDSRWDFQLVLPDGGRRAGFLSRWRNRGAPEFFGPNSSSIRFAIGPITPVPDYREQMENLRKIATRHGHQILSVDSIEIGGRRHATMVAAVPVAPGVTLRLKSYSLIVDGIEYFVTATIEPSESAIDAIVQTFEKL